MRTGIISLFFLLLLCWNKVCLGQIIARPDSIVFSGVIIHSETERGLSQVHCRYGGDKVVVSASDGSFRLKTHRGDIVTFTHVGFKSCSVTIPDTLFQKEYLLGVFMSPDTTVLAEVLILRREQADWRQNMMAVQKNMSGILKHALAPVDEMDAEMNQRMMINQYARSVEMKGHVDVGLGVGTQSLDVYHLLRSRKRLEKQEKSWLSIGEIDLLKKVYYLEKNRKSKN